MFTTCNLHTAFTRSAWKSSETRPRELPFHQSTFYNVGRTDPKIELSASPWQPTSISRPSNQVSITVMTSIAILERFSFPLLHSTNWRVMHRSDIGGRRSNFQFSETADKALPTPSQVKRFPFNRAPPFKSTFRPKCQVEFHLNWVRLKFPFRIGTGDGGGGEIKLSFTAHQKWGTVTNRRLISRCVTSFRQPRRKNRPAAIVSRTFLFGI